jgi:serine phosphatase RsbU (regulator of sigma subunit)/ABC-type amino acid transport substrate-binding protein
MAGQPRHVLLLALILAVPWCRPVTAPAQPGEPGSGRTVELTAEQDQWLAEHRVIRVAPDPDFAPFEYIDDDGLYQGISADYLNLVESRLGIRFTILQAETWDQVLDWARNGEADLLVCLAKTPQRTEYLAFTDPHIKLPGVIIATTESREALSLSDLKGKQVAVVSGYVWQDLLTLDHPDIELIPVPNIASALQMTSFGIVDAMVGDQATTSYFIQQEGLTNLRVAGRSGYSFDLAMGARKDWPQLPAILAKALATITPAERAAIHDRWIHLEQPSIFRKREFWVTVILSALGVGLVITGILVWNRALASQVAQRTRELNEELAWRKEAEEELRKHRDHLDELVKIRTAELQVANDRMKRDLEAAARVQQSLLPQAAPEVGGVKVTWHYRPCDELAGDILNVFPLDRTHVGIYVADVSGHGVAASLLSVAISRALVPEPGMSSLLVQPGDDPSEVKLVSPAVVATELNKRFPMEETGQKYFTILYGIFNIETRVFRYVSAGHPPIVRWAPGQAPKALEVSALPIGIDPEPDYEECVVQLEPGERILVYSDGVTEAMTGDFKQFGESRLMQVLEASSGQPLEVGVAQVLHDVEQWCDAGPKDDISMLGIETG